MYSINLYTVNKAIANALKSFEVAGIETNEAQRYCVDNFGENAKVYNNIAVNKKKYSPPYIAVGELSQVFKRDDVLGVEITICIPQSEIKEVETDGVIEYENYYKLSELAEIILETIQKNTKTTICYSLDKAMYTPEEISIGLNEYSGSLHMTYEKPISI